MRALALLAATFARMISRLKLSVSQLFAGSRLAVSSSLRASSSMRSVVWKSVAFSGMPRAGHADYAACIGFRLGPRPSIA
jgi:hypothetical protein